MSRAVWIALAALGCAGDSARTSLARVPMPTPASPELAWTPSPLDDLLPREGCDFGGTSRRECTRGCVVRVQVRDGEGTREEEHRFANTRRLVLVSRSDGSVSGRATVETEHARLDVVFEATRGAEAGWAPILDGIREPRRLGEHAKVTRSFVRRWGDGSSSLLESGGREPSYRAESQEAADGAERSRVQWRSRSESSRATSEVTIAERERAIVVESEWRRSEALPHSLFPAEDRRRVVTRERVDDRGRVVDVRRDEPGTMRSSRQQLAYDAHGRLTELREQGTNEDGETWRSHERIAYDDAGRVAFVEWVANEADDYVLPPTEPPPPARVVVERDGSGRVVAAQAPHWELRAERDARGRLVRERLMRGAVERTLERSYEHGRLVSSRARLRAYGRAQESRATYSYEGDCSEVAPPIVLGHEADADTPFEISMD